MSVESDITKSLDIEDLIALSMRILQEVGLVLEKRKELE